MTYHQRTSLATADCAPWWLRSVESPAYADERLCSAFRNGALGLAERLSSTVRRAFLHVVNAVGRLAKNRTERGWVQVSVAYVSDGAAVSNHTARAALNLACKALGCVRTPRGFLTVQPEAVAACLQVTDVLGAPQPAVHQEDGSDGWFQIETPKTRGVTACPCGHHANGDQHPSLAYDTHRGLATCQVTRAVFRAAHGGWHMVRRPHPTEVGVPAVPAGADNTYPWGEDPWTHRPGWGSYLTGTLHPDGLNRYPAQGRTLPEIMQWADRRYGGQAEQERAHVLAACGLGLPDRLVSLDRWVLDPSATRWHERDDGSCFPIQPVWITTGTEAVVYDLDGLDPATTEPDDGVVQAILKVVPRAVTIVATSETGIQVVVAGPGWADPVDLHRHLPTRRDLLATGAALLEAVGRGGRVDRSGWAPGRYVRRPGWRIKNGQPVRARLWWTLQPGS